MSGSAPPTLEIISRKKIGHYWHVRGKVNGELRTYRMPASYMPDDEAGQDEAMKQGLELIDGYEQERRG